MIFSAVFKPTTLFSLKESNSTNSGAKSLFLPSPYSIKMALLNQAITINGIEQFQPKEVEFHKKKKAKIVESELFKFIRDIEINYYLQDDSSFCVNNSFVKILKPSRTETGFQQTVAFREYVYISDSIELILNVNSNESKIYLQQYLHKINYFGKKGCFFQFIEYNDNPNIPNVELYNSKKNIFGVLQQMDDFEEDVTFEQVNNYSEKNTKRKKLTYILPLSKMSSSKGYTYYKRI